MSHNLGKRQTELSVREEQDRRYQLGSLARIEPPRGESRKKNRRLRRYSSVSRCNNFIKVRETRKSGPTLTALAWLLIQVHFTHARIETLGDLARSRSQGRDSDGDTHWGNHIQYRIRICQTLIIDALLYPAVSGFGN